MNAQFCIVWHKLTYILHGAELYSLGLVMRVAMFTLFIRHY